MGRQRLPAPELCRGPGGGRWAAGQAPLPARRAAGAGRCTVPGCHRTWAAADHRPQQSGAGTGARPAGASVTSEGRRQLAAAGAVPAAGPAPAGGRACRHQHHGHCLGRRARAAAGAPNGGGRGGGPERRLRSLPGGGAGPAPAGGGCLRRGERGALPGSRLSRRRVQLVFTQGDSPAPRFSVEIKFIAVIPGEELCCCRCERKRGKKMGGRSGGGSERHRGSSRMVLFVSSLAASLTFRDAAPFLSKKCLS